MLVYLLEDIFNLVVFQSFILFKYILTILHIQVGKNSSTLRIHLRKVHSLWIQAKASLGNTQLRKICFSSAFFFSFWSQLLFLNLIF